MKSKKIDTTQQPINENIRFDKLQVISNEGSNLGVLSRKEALEQAQHDNLDLVLMSDEGGLGYPVAKIMNFGKVLYLKKKQVSDSKKSQKIIQIKEIKLRSKIGEHDYQTKINQAIKFLKEGKHLKVTLIFRGREAAQRDVRGPEIFEKIGESFEAAGLTKVIQEKDTKTSQFWSRMYQIKQSKK